MLNNAQQLIHLVQEIDLYSYWKSKLPNSTDERVYQILTAVMEAGDEAHQTFVSQLNSDTFSILRNFGYRMSMFSVRQNSPDHLLKGLVALGFAAKGYDGREILMVLSVVYQSALKLKTDPDRLFKTAGSYAPTESIQKLIVGYLDRAPENKTIEEMGFRETYGPSGLVYHFGGRAIPEGLL